MNYYLVDLYKDCSNYNPGLWSVYRQNGFYDTQRSVQKGQLFVCLYCYISNFKAIAIKDTSFSNEYQLLTISRNNEMLYEIIYNYSCISLCSGYLLLAGRVIKLEEADVIQEVIQKHLKCKLTATSLYTLNYSTSLTSKLSWVNFLEPTSTCVPL